MIANKLKKETLAKLTDYFAHRPEIIAAYIFGSLITGKVRKGSDIDIALICQENLIKNQLTYRIAIITDLMSLLKRKVDVVILNSVNLLLRAQVFQKGLLIYESDSKERVSFQAKSMGLYYDYKRYFEFHSQNLKKKIKAYGLG
ncbi:MAG: nucleotidyltransferase domain-containing protein [candidate division WOR-3 bacterium]